MKKKILSLVLVIFMIVGMAVVPTWAETIHTSGMYKYYYTPSGNLVIVEITEKQSGTLVLPTYIDGQQVRGITSERAFINCDDVTKLVVPDGYLSLGYASGDLSAYGYNDLSSAYLSRNIRYIKLGKDVRSMLTKGDDNLEYIEVDPQNETLSSIDGVLLRKGYLYSSLYKYPAGKANSYYQIPDYVHEIEYGALDGAKNLKAISLPESSLRELGENYWFWIRNAYEDFIREGVMIYNPFPKDRKTFAFGGVEIDESEKFLNTNVIFNSKGAPPIKASAYNLEISPDIGKANYNGVFGTGDLFTFKATTSKGVSKISLSADVPFENMWEIPYEYLLEHYGLKYEDTADKRVWTCSFYIFEHGPRTFTLNIFSDDNIKTETNTQASVQVLENKGNQPEIGVTLNGNPIVFDVPPQIINDRTMVPLRAIFEAIGAEVKWNGETQTITASNNEMWVQLQVGNSIMHCAQPNAVFDERITLDSPPVIIDGRTLIPARAVAEAFKLNVDWNADTRTVIIEEW